MSKSPQRTTRGLIYRSQFVTPVDRKSILDYLASIYPIWEMRYSANNPPPDGAAQRQLLRPVYWLGNWQFACLNYYHPPKGIEYRCVKAEPFPPALQRLALQMEDIARNEFEPKDIPRRWHFNTCLINYYGNKLENGKWVDCARVGEHRDFEPGPVGSISLGDRALFQFVESKDRKAQSQVVLQQWLEDSSAQIFASDRYKKHLFHRVQRVEQKWNEKFKDNTTNFDTRRVNFTFRYVPDEHIYDLKSIPLESQQDVKAYLLELAQHSSWFAAANHAVLEKL